MVSLPCNYALAPRLPKLPLFREPRVVDTVRCAHYSQFRAIPQPINAVGTDPISSGPPESPPSPPTPPRALFSGGFKRREIKVPTLVLRLSAEELLRGEDATAAVDVAVSKGVGMVVLDSGDESGGRLYNAACILKSVVGDRAYVLIAERVDIAAAVGASGVVLSDEGIPALVARNMMTKSKSDSVYLPLVARTVRTANSAMCASSSEGADFLIMSTDRDSDAVILENSVTQHVKVPIFFSVMSLQGDDLLFNVASRLLQSGACGIVISLDDMKYFDDDHLNRIFSAAHEAKRRVMRVGYPNYSRTNINDVRVVSNEKQQIAGFSKLDDKVIQLIETERELSDKAVAVICKAAPMMKEVSLLVDAASRLTEPFLLVIVGEFNSGKSTVINALLGTRYLKEGVVPTTNEITLLSYSEDANGHNGCERHPNGQFVCYLSSQILKNMNVVDTPGTNVILQRQQRLTEEFVPHADLILFVISSDRPLTESEVSFLLYVQQWKKKVVFVLNKLDLYQNTRELEEAIAFVKENTRKLLNAEVVRLFPVSARAALEAKLSSLSCGKNYEDALLNDPRWMKSRFYELEMFLFSFLDRSTDMGKERMRLKLETPIGIADNLLTSCERLVKQEFETASQDLTSINDVVNTVRDHALKMERECISWRKQIITLIETAKARTTKHLESTLQLSNVNLISTYALKGERSSSIPSTSILQNEIIGPSLSDARRLILEYVKWLHSTNAREEKLYVEIFDKRWDALVDLKDRMHSDSCELTGEGELSIKVMGNFSASAAAKLLEQEIREVVLGTFGGLGAAGLSASLLTSVLPTTMEDLLALAFCSTGGFLAISNFPARRNKAIEKVRRVADKLACEIEEAMQKDLLHSADKLGRFVEAISKPYQRAAQQRIDRLLEIQDEMANIVQKLQALKVEIQNLHLS